MVWAWPIKQRAAAAARAGASADSGACVATDGELTTDGAFTAPGAGVRAGTTDKLGKIACWPKVGSPENGRACVPVGGTGKWQWEVLQG